MSLVCAGPATGESYYYRPDSRTPEPLQQVLRHLAPGSDAFPEEKTAAELAAELKQLSRAWREDLAHAPSATARLLAPEFRGSRLVPSAEIGISGSPSLEVSRAATMSEVRALDGASFANEMAALLADFKTIEVAELLMTYVEHVPGPTPVARTEVRYDIVGAGNPTGRTQRLGRWQIEWRRSEESWRIASWTAPESRRGHASRPVFTDVTAAALGGIPSLHRQLGPGNDAWLGRLDSVFEPDVFGLHGISAGDADGDSLDDLYVSQPAGLPNRLFRNRGDGTFEDATDRSGLGVLDSTSQSLFVDVDNDADQDLVLVTRTGLLLFTNDGSGRFSRAQDAFQLATPLRGSPMAIAMADYDRDGFPDLYLCNYSYFIGASEDKAGLPTPYHDAQSGPPNVLFRNDGHGRFQDVTRDVGLDENNNRFSFAAAWADYDSDGWPDLLVVNDFGRKSLYRNLGLVDGKVRFKDVAAAAGVEDHGAGMSATWFDYDGDGLLDIYNSNMWSAAGQRVTRQPGFMPDAPPEVRALYRRHARGNSLFRNRGDGTFEDVTIAAAAEMGRWAWSADVLDFDLDGWEDLYVVNGMLSRDAEGEGGELDTDSFNWRQLVAASPLTPRSGTAYDEAWRAMNRLLMADGSQASHERNVFLRNDGRGGFDEVSGVVGLDLDQDGRSFAAFDYDRDGDPDLAVYSARSSPQLRIFRNDLGADQTALRVNLTGTRSNRDGIGARVTIESGNRRQTQILLAGSGFLSQRSKELAFGLGRGGSNATVTITWPSGLVQTLSDLPANHRVWIEEGKADVRTAPIQRAPARGLPDSGSREPTPDGTAMVADASEPMPDTWLYEPVPAPDFSLPDLDGREHSLASLRGKPALVLFWATWAPPSRAAVEALARQREAIEKAGAAVFAVAVDTPGDGASVRAATNGLGVTTLIATKEMAAAYATLNRYLFARRGDLRLPTAFLLSRTGEVVKVYRDPALAPQLASDMTRLEVPSTERLARAVPFAGTMHGTLAARDEFQYALDLAEQGLDAPALVAFARVDRWYPTAMSAYNLGTLSMKAGRPAEAKVAFERALKLQPDHPEAANSLGTLLAYSGELPNAVARFRAALAAKPEFPDALNNLGYALFQMGQDEEAYGLYQRALEMQPGFPEALNNLGIFFGQHEDLERAEDCFAKAFVNRPDYGEAGNNLALVLAARGDSVGAVSVLRRVLEESPAFEMAYVTLGRIYAEGGQRVEAMDVLERLLQRNPRQPLGLQLLAQLRQRGR